MQYMHGTGASLHFFSLVIWSHFLSSRRQHLQWIVKLGLSFILKKSWPQSNCIIAMTVPSPDNINKRLCSMCCGQTVKLSAMQQWWEGTYSQWQGWLWDMKKCLLQFFGMNDLTSKHRVTRQVLEVGVAQSTRQTQWDVTEKLVKPQEP